MQIHVSESERISSSLPFVKSKSPSQDLVVASEKENQDINDGNISLPLMGKRPLEEFEKG